MSIDRVWLNEYIPISLCFIDDGSDVPGGGSFDMFSKDLTDLSHKYGIVIDYCRDNCCMILEYRTMRIGDAYKCNSIGELYWCSEKFEYPDPVPASEELLHKNTEEWMRQNNISSLGLRRRK